MTQCEHCRDLAARAAIVRLDIAARRFLRVPFMHQGRNPRVGIDCVGLLSVVEQALGLALGHHDRTDYDKNPSHGALDQQLRSAFGDPVSCRCLLPGSVISIDYEGETRHVGIIGEHPDGLSLIHTSSSVGRVVERRLTPAYVKHIDRIYRLEVAP